MIICELCEISSLYRDFQEDYSTSVLCVNCYYDMFKDILDIEEPRPKCTKDYKYNIIQETKKTVVLDGEWAQRFL